jgi:tetratricopeptide (TPR) repeat protein
LNGLGNLHNELKKYSEAIECFSKALEIPYLQPQDGCVTAPGSSSA